MSILQQHLHHQEYPNNTIMDISAVDDERQEAFSGQHDSFGFLHAVTEQIGSLCACTAASFETSTMVDYSERYWNDMDASVNVRSVIANYAGRVKEQQRRRGGQEEYKECEMEDESLNGESALLVPVQSFTKIADESIIIHRDFYKQGGMVPTQIIDDSIIIQRDFYNRGDLFASSAIGLEEDDDGSLMFSRGTCKKVRTVSPTPESPPSILRPRVALPSPDIVQAIAIDDDSEIMDRKTNRLPAAMFFHDIPFYTRSPATPGNIDGAMDAIPPITSADTCTTVSTARSDASLLDIEDSENDTFWVHELSMNDSPARVVVSECFRPGRDDGFTTPPQPERTSCLSPPRFDYQSRYLLRMKPSNYTHGDDWEEHGLLLTMPALR